MTTTDPFTTPAEAERAARVEQAQDLLARAAGVKHVARSTFDGKVYRYNYVDGVAAVRDAMVGQGHAMLAVRGELADIAASLRTLAALPAAVQWLGDSVTAVKDEVAEVAGEVLGCNQATTLGAMDVAAAIREAGEILEDRLAAIEEALSRPRWWQWRRRREVRRQQAAIAEAVTASQTDPWQVSP
ncbi:hypothetical protein [Nonomuraea guangzhouensis]|uniref:Uncharacterized protein n=1 Tax=Nonomuraea guangzhouensis TaxID=1291555 RepID=A0ABW4GYN7_9ACTN|nr:hypothetical protein [Nonomuraea guangzhouensis]